jgi:conjugal transfer mating pair stabilization protein TraG
MSAANEVNSGNRNFDNVSMRNISANKLDTNTSYKKGASEMQMADNSLIRTSNLGESYSVSGAGISSMVSGYKFDMNSHMESQLSNSINDQMSVANNSQVGYSNAKSDAINKGINIIKDLSKNQSLLDSYAKESGSDDVKSLSQVVSTFNNLVKDQGYTETNAFQAAAGGSLRIPLGPVGGINADANYSRGNTRSTHYGNQEGAGSQDGTSRGLNLIEKALNSKNFTEATNLNRSLSNSFQSNISEMSNHHKSETQALDKLHSLQSTMSQLKSSGTSQVRDITGEVTEMTAREMNISNNDARKLLESGNRNAWEIANQAADNIAAKTISEEYKVSIPGIVEFHQGGREALSQVDQKYQFNYRNDARNNENQKESEISESNLGNEEINLQKGVQIKEEINNKNQSRAQEINQTYENSLNERDNLREKVKDKNNKWTWAPKNLKRDDDFEDK